MECKVTILSPLGKALFPEGATIEKLAGGYRFTEGPVWDDKEGCLYFTDFQDHRIYCWTKTGGAALYRENAHRAVGLAMAADRRLVAAETITRRVAYTGTDTSEPIADSYEGKPFNSPNDVIVAKDGRVLFTDPYSTAMGGERGQPFNGVYAAEPSGGVRLLYGGMGRPNGLAFSQDESILYVNDTDRQHILAFSMREDGSAGEPRLFAKLDPSYGPGAPDGMKVDTKGNVFVTGPGGLWVFSPEGEAAAILNSPEFVGNFCLGEPDGRTIYLTASTSVYAVTGLSAEQEQ